MSISQGLVSQARKKNAPKARIPSVTRIVLLPWGRCQFKVIESIKPLYSPICIFFLVARFAMKINGEIAGERLVSSAVRNVRLGGAGERPACRGFEGEVVQAALDVCW